MYILKNNNTVVVKSSVDFVYDDQTHCWSTTDFPNQFWADYNKSYIVEKPVTPPENGAPNVVS